MTDMLTKPRTVEGRLFYSKDTGQIESFHANDLSLDTVQKEAHDVAITDARSLAEPPQLDQNGFELFTMPSVITDWRDTDRVNALHPDEIAAFVKKITGADEVLVTGPPILRWGERSKEAGTRNNSYAARLVHSDSYFTAAKEQTIENNPRPDCKVKRCAHHNVWRTFSGPPIDVPLTICDAQSVSDDDVIEASAAFDVDGKVIWRLPSMNFRYSPGHRWYYFSGMTPDEVLVFKRWDTDAGRARYVPHTAFTDPSVGETSEPRASVEMRTFAYWYE
ncbi:hypothetical protein D6851_05000 [Altericroceibacterium spongiae]|uniref:Methyltransferase n=1 Tax=Altericroceibacterium spongiae TaxID=2320269 RepID=A0A420EPH4_9SPHN|nr:CmcJ/NvfI family oxidoreductase [Altericroceibacterium spongiae]RKF22579.1 hypothetical protein D6851_05000 [Altericroceibacterium spongiae]